MERAPGVPDQRPVRRRDFASIPRGWVIAAVSVMAWIVLMGIGLVAWALLT